MLAWFYKIFSLEGWGQIRSMIGSYTFLGLLLLAREYEYETLQRVILGLHLVFVAGLLRGWWLDAQEEKKAREARNKAFDEEWALRLAARQRKDNQKS